MRYLTFIFLLIAAVLIAGCTGGNQNSTVTPKATINYNPVMVAQTLAIITTKPTPVYQDSQCYNAIGTILITSVELSNQYSYEHNKRDWPTGPTDPSQMNAVGVKIFNHEKNASLFIKQQCKNLYDHNITVASREFVLYYENSSRAWGMRTGTFDRRWAEANIITTEAWDNHGSIAVEDYKQYYRMNNSEFGQHQSNTMSYTNNEIPP